MLEENATVGRRGLRAHLSASRIFDMAKRKTKTRAARAFEEPISEGDTPPGPAAAAQEEELDLGEDLKDKEVVDAGPLPPPQLPPANPAPGGFSLLRVTIASIRTVERKIAGKPRQVPALVRELVVPMRGNTVQQWLASSDAWKFNRATEKIATNSKGKPLIVEEHYDEVTRDSLLAEAGWVKADPLALNDVPAGVPPTEAMLQRLLQRDSD